MTARFVDFPLKVISPRWDSPLTDVVIDLDYLRRLDLKGDTPAAVFFQIKDVFHMLESLGSARIEGNHTTLADYVESKIAAPATHEDSIREIGNIERAMAYVEEVVSTGAEISEQLIRELHALTVTDLKREGDETPGQYRSRSVQIGGSEHLPPPAVSVSGYMRELCDFINQGDAPKYDLLKMALTHHRFCWIHPFGNGNGRTVRLLSYAMMIKYGFNMRAGGRVLNPTAVFCNDRNAYYAMLSRADEGTDEGLETWCLYVLGGIRDELAKVDRLTRYDFLSNNVLRPALHYCRSRELLTADEDAILSLAISKGEFKSADIQSVLPHLTERQRTYSIAKLLEGRMIAPTKAGGRYYTISFANSYLLRGVIHALEHEGFIPPFVRTANDAVERR